MAQWYTADHGFCSLAHHALVHSLLAVCADMQTDRQTDRTYFYTFRPFNGREQQLWPLLTSTIQARRLSLFSHIAQRWANLVRTSCLCWRSKSAPARHRHISADTSKIETSGGPYAPPLQLRCPNLSRTQPSASELSAAQLRALLLTATPLELLNLVRKHFCSAKHSTNSDITFRQCLWSYDRMAL